MVQPGYSTTLAPVGAFLIYCSMWFIAYWGIRSSRRGRKRLLDCYLVMLIGFLTELAFGWSIFVFFYGPSNLLATLNGLLFFIVLWSIGPWIDLFIQGYALRNSGT